MESTKFNKEHDTYLVEGIQFINTKLPILSGLVKMAFTHNLIKKDNLNLLGFELLTIADGLDKKSKSFEDEILTKWQELIERYLRPELKF